MGLDMYLSEKEWHRISDETKLKALREILDVDALHVGEMLVTTEVEHIYWRKVNAVHGWFVDNVQDGEDDCSEYPVAVEDLQKLKEACVQVIDDPELAEELLPTRAGCFFGDNAYDEHYLNDLHFTIASINRLMDHVALKRLVDPEYVPRLIYQSSW